MIKLISSNGEVQYDVNEYVCDTLDDIAKLPKNCAMGSFAIVISTGDVFILNSNKEWVVMS